MKKLLCAFFALLLAASMPGCSQRDSVLSSLGEPSVKEMYVHGDFGDFTDYGKYLFDAVTPESLAANPCFIQVGEQTEEILSYVDNFENWVRVISNSTPDDEMVTNYDFDRSIVDSSDYFYVKTKEGEPIGSGTYRKFDNYTLYFFDLDTQILYYFHSNI